MSPPIEIDGTDITGATIDGTDVQEITVDGQTVFSAGANPVVDFDASTQPSGSISSWTDEVAGITITAPGSTPTVISGGLNGLNYIEQNQANFGPNTFSVLASPPMTFGWVARVRDLDSAGGTKEFVLDGDDFDGPTFTHDNGSNMEFDMGTGQETSTNMNTNWNSYAAVVDGNSGVFVRNSTIEMQNVDFGSNSFSGLTIGAASNLNQEQFMDIAQFQVFDEALNALNVSADLRSKWGI